LYLHSRRSSTALLESLLGRKLSLKKTPTSVWPFPISTESTMWLSESTRTHCTKARKLLKKHAAYCEVKRRRVFNDGRFLCQ
jgi:hypothetical protein